MSDEDFNKLIKAVLNICSKEPMESNDYYGGCAWCGVKHKTNKTQHNPDKHSKDCEWAILRKEMKRLDLLND